MLRYIILLKINQDFKGVQYVLCMMRAGALHHGQSRGSQKTKKNENEGGIVYFVVIRVGNMQYALLA